MCTFIQQYVKCLLFGIYPRVGENNMCTFNVSNVYYIYFYNSRVEVNNMCTFTAIFHMFDV